MSRRISLALLRTLLSQVSMATWLAIGFAAGTFAHAQEVSEPFKRLDRNGDGQLTKDEFSGPLFNQIDANGDGVVTAEEDIAFMRRLAAQRPNGRAGQGANAGARVADTVEALLDVPYAGTENPRQRLDLYLPKARDADKLLPLVVFIHGGAWQAGDKRGGYRTLAPLVESGDYAIASVGYRLTNEAIWPAQIHDCKAAIRWLRGNAAKHGLDPERIGVTGPSAGGHLVAMLGTSGDVAELEGELGDQRQQSSRVACVVDQFGPTDLLAMGGQHNDARSPESKLVGGAVQEKQELARQASPTSFVTPDDPPFLFIHGTADPLVPFQQSELLHQALRGAGVESLLIPVEGGGHGNFGSPEVLERTRRFFDRHLRGLDTTVSAEPIQPGGR